MRDQTQCVLRRVSYRAVGAVPGRLVGPGMQRLLLGDARLLLRLPLLGGGVGRVDQLLQILGLLLSLLFTNFDFTQLGQQLLLLLYLSG